MEKTGNLEHLEANVKFGQNINIGNISNEFHTELTTYLKTIESKMFRATSKAKATTPLNESNNTRFTSQIIE